MTNEELKKELLSEKELLNKTIQEKLNFLKSNESMEKAKYHFLCETYQAPNDMNDELAKMFIQTIQASSEHPLAFNNVAQAISSQQENPSKAVLNRLQALRGVGSTNIFQKK